MQLVVSYINNVPTYRRTSPYLYKEISDDPVELYGTCPYCGKEHNYTIWPEHVMKLSKKQKAKKSMRQTKEKIMDMLTEAWYKVKK
jgi:hypothetical protein